MVWKLEDGSLVISGVGASLIPVTGLEGYIKDVTRAGGERDAEMIRTMGNYEYFDPKNTNMIEHTATCIGSNALFETMLLGGSTAGGGFMGSAVEQWPRKQYDFHMIFTDPELASGPQLKISCLSSFVTNVGWKGTNTDSAEETLTWKTLPKNYTKRYTQNKIGSPL